MGAINPLLLLLLLMAYDSDSALLRAAAALAASPDSPMPIIPDAPRNSGACRALQAEFDEADDLAAAAAFLNRPRPDSNNNSPEQPIRRRRVIAHNDEDATGLCSCQGNCSSRLPQGKIAERMEIMKGKATAQRHEWVFNDLDNAAPLPHDNATRDIVTRIWGVLVCKQFYQRVHMLGTKCWQHLTRLIKDNLRYD